MSRRHPLELSGAEFEELVHEASALLARHLDALPAQPSVFTGDAGGFARSLAEPAPEKGADRGELLRLLFERVIPRSFNTAGPGYVAYIPGGGLPESAVAELIAAATNRYAGVFAAAPGLAQLEENVVRWFCDIVGFPHGSGGILTSGGSLAGFSALVAARRARLPEDFLRGTIYVSDQAHHSIAKAAMLAGFPAGNVRAIETDERFHIRLDRLAEAIAADRGAGKTPFFLVGNAGTTNTGGVDDLPALARLARAEEMWFHVDGAYGAFFALTRRGRAVLAGIEEADSLVLDPHKGLFLPYGTGCLLVRDARTLERAHAVEAEYLPASPGEEDLPDFSRRSPELSRGWRGLRVWLPVKLHGFSAFREQLDEKLDLAELAHAELARMPGVAIVAPPELSIVAFRLAPGGRPGEDEDARNRRLIEAVSSRQRVFLSGTTLHGRFAVRICVLSFRTHRERMLEGLADIRDVARQLSAGAV